MSSDYNCMSQSRMKSRSQSRMKRSQKEESEKREIWWKKRNQPQFPVQEEILLNSRENKRGCHVILPTGKCSLCFLFLKQNRSLFAENSIHYLRRKGSPLSSWLLIILPNQRDLNFMKRRSKSWQKDRHHLRLSSPKSTSSLSLIISETNSKS